jgi:hypothetical protein
MAKERIYTVDKFLGLNESGDGHTELKMGEASKIINFTITDNHNLSLRPGISRIDRGKENTHIVAAWSGCVRKGEYLIIVEIADGADRINLYTRAENGAFSLIAEAAGKLKMTEPGQTVKIFPFGEYVYVMGPNNVISVRAFDRGTYFVEEQPYIPTVITGASPAGGGTALENLNLLTNLRRITYSCDGKTATFVLPEEAKGVHFGESDGGIMADFEFDKKTHSVTFPVTPPEGINNFTITYFADPDQTAKTFASIASMPYVEAYNGAANTRLFFYGDGTNVCYYTGITLSGEPSALYVPALNEIAVDFSGSPITAMIRHYSKLLCFKPDGAYSITYQPTTLDDGSVIAGFTLRSTQKGVGCDVPGQVQLVNNYPRTICDGALYEWKIPTSYLADERYAKNISAPISQTLKAADTSRIVTCDDTRNTTFYVFLNDADGTVLVNRYNLGVWTVYRSPLCTNVKFAFINSGTMVFVTDSRLYYFDGSSRYDAPLEDGGDPMPIAAEWESGYMHFDADYLRKYSSELWLSVLPQPNSKLTVTAATDRRDSYVEKTVSNGIFGGHGNISYSHWSYVRSKAPRINRVRMKVKKFVYYKLIIRVTDPGAVATVLSFDQRIRYAGYAK